LAFEADVLSTIISDIKEAVAAFEGTDAIIVADRTDIAAYVSPDEYKHILKLIGLERSPILDIVDQLYYLPSVALEDPSKYEGLKATNPARYETLEHAQATCRANLASVVRHPELHVAWGGFEDFGAKIESLANAILHPEREAEIKLKPSHPNRRTVEHMLEQSEVLTTASIKQSYHELDGICFRLRKTITDHNEVLYAFAIKTGEGLQRQEIARRLTESDYLCLAEAKKIAPPLEKTRYSFLHRDVPSIDQPRVLPAKRLWVADRYFDRRLDEWSLETDVHSEAEQAFILVQMRHRQSFERATMGAEKLARHLGSLAVA
jgi:hypothetical protein